METFEHVNIFVRNFKDGVLHPFTDAEIKSVNGHDEVSLAARAGHLSGQLTNAAFTASVAKKLLLLKDATALLPELEIGSSKLVGDSFLHAPASLVPREILLAKSVAHTDAGLRANIHMTPETYSLMSDLSHQVESTHSEITTYKLTNPAKPSEVFEKTKPFKFYKLKGVDTKIGMPVEFAESLESIRNARQRSAQLDGLQRDRFDNKHASTLPGYDSMLLPEQMPLFLRELPNPSLVKELLLIPEADVKAGAAVDREIPGRVQLFDFKKFRDL